MTDTIDFFSINVEQTDWLSNRQVLMDIRHTVFVEEQQVPESEELDEHDPEAMHWVAWGEGNQAMATARLVGNKIGRMAVLQEYRDKGVGSSLMRAIITYAINSGIDTLVLDAQKHALPFYEGLGFSVTGPEFMDAGIPHLPMACDVGRYAKRTMEPAMPDISEELRKRIKVDSADDFARYALEIAHSAKRDIRIFSERLDPLLYDSEAFCDGIMKLATRHPYADVQLLVRDTGKLVNQFHHLVELFMRLTSRIQLRKLNPERETLHTEFMVGDEDMVLYNQEQDGYKGYFYRYAPMEARRLNLDFDSLWNSSEPDPAIRRLHI
ncbi:MAG: hypothetical protein VR73_12535 [Gammaproteobacteria bacterium BRH_c0]|nr:MAG: hypothetical protein VR73_12535 [Gammaproteobacteria bacterium BRH_c0]